MKHFRLVHRREKLAFRSEEYKFFLAISEGIYYKENGHHSLNDGRIFLVLHGNLGDEVGTGVPIKSFG